MVDAAMMHAPRFCGEGVIDFIEKSIPTPGPGELLIAIKANALCGSERGQFLNGASVTPGHEAAGVVAQAGPDTRVAVETPGVIYLMDYCGACRSCALGLTNQCLAKRGDIGFNRDGGYGPYTLVPEHIFFPVDPEIVLPEATMLLDVMGTSSHAIGRAQLVHPDIQSVLIAGAGPVGLGVLAMVKLLLGDAMPVFISDISPPRLELAATFGGVPIDLNELRIGTALSAHGYSGVHAAFDTSGKSVGRRACVDALAKRGVLVCIGHGESLELQVSPDLIANEGAVLGSEYFRFNELPANLARLRDHRDYLAPIITHTFAVEDIQRAFELFFSGATGKVGIVQ